MNKAALDVTRLGLASLAKLFAAQFYWLGRAPKTWRKLWAEIPFRAWRDLEMAGESFWGFLCGFHLARLFAKDKIELIHSPWASGSGTASWVASRLTGIPFCFSARAGDIYPQDGALREKMRDCLFVRVNNAANARYLHELAPQQSHKVHLVYNALTLARHEPAPLKMQKPVKLLALGRFARTKGYEVLLAACRILKDANFPFRLTLAGDGFLGPKLKFLAWRYALNDCLDFPGFITHDKVAGLMAGQDIFLMPSVVHSNGDRDGIPNVIMEALSHGLPVIASDVCGISEVIEDGLTGLLVGQRDPAALAQAVRRLARDPQSARAMARTGRERVERMFDSKLNTRQLLELYVSQARAARAAKANQEVRPCAG